ncbi:hypothetical protein D3C87_1619190 [compost metagenome]
MAVDSGLEKLEDKLLEFQSRNTDDIKSFCEEFFKSHSSNIMIPYIDGNSDKYFGNIPENHVIKLKLLREYWTNESQKRLEERNALKSAGDGVEIEDNQIESLLKTMLAAKKPEK